MKILEVLTKARLTGNKGEAAAAKYLRRHGYKILKRNYVADNNEIDIIARNRTTLVFVEVKSRTVGTSDFLPRPAAAVDQKKQQAILKAAGIFIALNYEYRGLRQRFDVIEVYLENGKAKTVKHLINTFDRDTAYRRNYQ